MAECEWVLLRYRYVCSLEQLKINEPVFYSFQNALAGKIICFS